MTVYGYARVSTSDQSPAAQAEALRSVCDEVREETASGGQSDRPVLGALLEALRPGDVVVVYKIDRMARSLRDLLRFLSVIEEAGAGFRSVTEAVDTTNAAGRMLMQMLGAFAEFERAMIRERTRAGLEAARRRGTRLGRRRSLSPEQVQLVRELLNQGKTQREVADLLSVSQSTVSRAAAPPR
jgi:DNA invertase Pin-like site-specific DNA recombinase